MIIKNNAGYYQIQELLLPRLIHGFSTKKFGNLSYKYGDKKSVDKNKLNFARSIGINIKNVAKARLIHGTKIAVVNSGSELNEDTYIEETDALITNSLNVSFWMLTGDCAPFLFFDPVKRVIGLAHSGWRGTVAKLPTMVFTKMITALDCDPKNILIGIGPSIEKCHYVKAKPIFPENFPDWNNYLTPENENKLRIDLNGFSIDQLTQVGALRQNIFYSNFCTYDHHDEFFCSQRETAGFDNPGRFASVIQMT